MKNIKVEKMIDSVKEFLITFSFAKTVTLILDESTIGNMHTKYNETHKKIVNIYSSYCIWLCMNEIYPSWFDISIHPAQFDTEMEAYECLIKYINEYHENKYVIMCQKLIDNLKNIRIADFVDIYSLVIAAALASDDREKYVHNILSTSHQTQECVYKIIEYLDTLEDEPSNKNTSTLLNSSGKTFNREEEVGTNANESLKNEIKELKEKIRSTESENERLNNLVIQQEKTIEENKKKIQDLQKQINIENEKSKKSYISQIEEQEKKINELQSALEKEKKEKGNSEANLNKIIKQLEDEQHILKQENATIDDLQKKIKIYKEKLEATATIQNLNKELQEKLQQNTQKMIDMEMQIEKIQKESENVEKYKDKCADLDANLVNLRKENEILKQNINEKIKSIEKLKKELETKVMSYEKLKKEKNVDHFKIGFNDLDQTEELIRMKKENENLKKQLGIDTNEKSKRLNDLENEIDDLKRINQKLETKISELIGKEDNKNTESVKEQYELLLKESEEKQKKIEELTETNQKIMLQIANFNRVDDSSTKEKIIKLEAELMIEKKNCSQIEETTKNKLSKEFNSVLQILKEQLQIREKENEHYKEALKNQIDMSNEEQKLLSGVVHSLGLKYKQLQTYNLSLRNEIAGIKLRKKKYAEANQ